MSDNVFTALFVGIIVLAASLAATGLYREYQKKIAEREYLATCEYLGSRVEKGFGSTTIYAYDCNGVREESTTRVTP